jgi:hypothetical protein
MLNRRLIGLLALLLSAGLTLSACGDDAPSDANNGNNSNNGANNGNNDNPDAGTDDSGDEGDAEDPADADEQNDGATLGCSADNPCAEGYTCNEGAGVCEVAPSGCDLEGADRPERCDATEDETTFGPASLVTALELAEASCCFDMDGDGEPNNAFSFLRSVPEEGVINENIAESIASGSLVLMFEHAGLTELPSTEPYSLNVWLGENFTPPAPTDLLIDPASVDEGTYPQAVVPNAKIENGVLTAGPGTVNLSISLGALLSEPLSLRISQARIEATVDESSSIEDGIVISSGDPATYGGKLGGAVRLDDLIGAVNSFADTCTCFGLEGEDFIIYDASTPDVKPACNDAYTTDSCDPESTCVSITQVCPLVGVFGTLTDVDTDGDGTDDAISIGTTFNTTGVNITGIAEASAP